MSLSSNERSIAVALITAVAWWVILGITQGVADGVAFLLMVLALIFVSGCLVGLALRSPWGIIIAPSAIFAGGLVQWFMSDWGLRWPVWDMFFGISVIVFSLLMFAAGLPAFAAGMLSERYFSTPTGVLVHSLTSWPVS